MAPQNRLNIVWSDSVCLLGWQWLPGTTTTSTNAHTHMRRDGSTRGNSATTTKYLTDAFIATKLWLHNEFYWRRRTLPAAARWTRTPILVRHCWGKTQKKAHLTVFTRAGVCVFRRSAALDSNLVVFAVVVVAAVFICEIYALPFFILFRYTSETSLFHFTIHRVCCCCCCCRFLLLLLWAQWKAQ